MAKTVVGLFDDFDDAQRVVNDLTDIGIPRDEISIVRKHGGDANASGDDAGAMGQGAAAGATTGAVVGGAAGLIASLSALAIPGFGPVLAAGPLIATLTGAGIGAATGGIIGALVHAGVPEEEARYYNEGVNRGGTLVTVRADDQFADRAADVMNRHHAIDIDQRAATWRTGGWAPDAGATTGTTESTMQNRPVAQPVASRSDAGRSERSDWKAGESDAGKERIPVVEEQLNVGKREVRGGGVRVYAHMTERPVSETVNLREEKVNVERRPVDRPATEADLRNLNQQQTIEVTETREVPVVQKEARVVEEIVVNKHVEQRQETIRDTVRETDVRVEQMPGQHTREFRDEDYRPDYDQRFARSGLTYDQYRPAFEYGSELARDQRYRGKDWTALESDARTDWERRNPGSESGWEKIKDGVRHAWDRARAKV